MVNAEFLTEPDHEPPRILFMAVFPATQERMRSSGWFARPLGVSGHPDKEFTLHQEQEHPAIHSVREPRLAASVRSQWSVRLDLGSRGLPDHDDHFFIDEDSA